MGKTVYDLLSAAAKFDGSLSANEDIRTELKKHGHDSGKTAGCTNTVMAMFYSIGAIDIIGGYENNNAPLMQSAKKAKLWHVGSKEILPGDIVIFGRNGKSNHTELAVGADLDISGNYKVDGVTGCSRRKRSSHSSNILGYIRPKYSAMPEMDNLQVAVVATDCILGVYGTKSTRAEQLSVFGKANAEKIQAEVERVYDDVEDTVFIMAVSAIAGFHGNDKYREKRLGNWSGKVQDKINEIYELRGRSVDEAAQLVLDDKFGKNAVRKLLLQFCGYDDGKVQKRVNELLEPAKGNESSSQDGSIVSLFRGVPRGSKSDDGLQGDCIILKSGKNALITDTMLTGALEKITSEIKGMENVCLFFTHEHGDHMSKNANKLVKAGLIKKCYVPSANTISSSSKYKNRYKSLVNDCKKYGVEVVELTQGSKFAVGSIKGEVLFQQTKNSKDKINMHSLCTLFTIGAVTCLNCGDHHCGEKESSFKAPGHVTVYISSHHQLFTGDTQGFVNAISPDWIIGSGWQSWPNATVGQDPKTKRAQKNYQRVGNLLPGDVCGRVELSISGGVITAKGEKNMTGKTVKYSIDGKTYQKTVHVCTKAAFVKVKSMIPAGAKFI